MIAAIVQLVIVSMWAVMLVAHTRRLLRLAQTQWPSAEQQRQLRHKLTRVWWWLGREEYWRAVQNDGLRCMQLTLMIFLMAWGLFV